MANWNYFQWMCVTLVISAHSGGYRHDTRTGLYLYPDEFESTSEDPIPYYRRQFSTQISYSSWARNNAQRREGVSARSIAEDSRRNEDLHHERKRTEDLNYSNRRSEDFNYDNIRNEDFHHDNSRNEDFHHDNSRNEEFYHDSRRNQNFQHGSRRNDDFHHDSRSNDDFHHESGRGNEDFQHQNRKNENLNHASRERIATSRSSPRTENGTFKIINIIPASHQNQRADSKEADTPNPRDSIVFPEEVQAKSDKRSFAPVVTDSCKQGHTLCLSVANYPENYIASLLSNTADDVQSQLTVDELEQVRISQRIGEDPDEFELCTYHEKVVYPQAAQNKESKWLMIINQQNYKQGFRVELCYKESSACSPAATFRLGMEASCKQKYVLRRMTAVDDNGQLVTDHFRLPSCCSCVVRYSDVYSGRKKRSGEREP